MLNTVHDHETPHQSLDHRVAVFCHAFHRHVRPPVRFRHDRRMGQYPGLVKNLYRLRPIRGADHGGDFLAHCRQSGGPLRRPHHAGGRASAGGNRAAGLRRRARRRHFHHWLRPHRRGGFCHRQHASHLHGPCQALQGKPRARHRHRQFRRNGGAVHHRAAAGHRPQLFFLALEHHRCRRRLRPDGPCHLGHAETHRGRSGGAEIRNHFR